MLPAPQRLLCLFGYETDGGPTSRLWQDPGHVASPAGQPGTIRDERFQAWVKSKRAFLRGEIFTGHWIKIGEHGYASQVQCHLDGTLREAQLFAPWEHQHGTWSFIAHAVVRMHVAGWELDIIATKTGWLHAGIEEHQDDPTYRVYFKVIHVPMGKGS